jgi:hypothetical protein
MATDQEIRDAGFKYIPQQKYLLNPFQIPTPDPVTDQGIVATNAFTDSGGDNFSVYNADPNTIINMNPNRYALQDARYDNELSYVDSPITGYTTDTEAMKHMAMYPDYYGLNKPPPSKISQLISKGIGLIPGYGTFSKFADFASGLLPVNRRAIMENQLGTTGVMVDNIGRIVVGPGGSYNTPEGIMAGYNANKMTDKTFDKRTDTMRETLKDKYKLNDTQIDGLIDGSLTDEEMEEINNKAFNKITGRTSDIVTNIRNIAIAKKNFGNVTDTTNKIFNFKTDTKGGGNNKKTGSGKTYVGGGGSGVPDQIGGGDGGFDKASHDAGKASAAAQEQSNRDYARGKFSQGGIASIL